MISHPILHRKLSNESKNIGKQFAPDWGNTLPFVQRNLRNGRVVGGESKVCQPLLTLHQPLSKLLNKDVSH